MTTDIRETLRGTALFEPLDSDGLDRFVDVGRVEYWPEGSSIVEQGENGPRMMVILEGQGKVSRLDASGVPRRIATLGPGDVVGEIALLLDMPRTATVEALEILYNTGLRRPSCLDSRPIAEQPPEHSRSLCG